MDTDEKVINIFDKKLLEEDTTDKMEIDQHIDNMQEDKEAQEMIKRSKLKDKLIERKNNRSGKMKKRNFKKRRRKQN